MMNYNYINVIKKIPILTNIIDIFVRKFNTIEDENMILAQQMINTRLLFKREKKEKVNVVFICHRPAVWRSMKSIYEELKKDERFKITIVSIPQITPKGEFDDEGADEYFKCEDSIVGFDNKTKKFLDIRELRPDYVFFQQPYNSIYPQQYRSSIISKYAKICYLSYFTFLDNLTIQDVSDECYPFDYFRNISLFFSQNDKEKKYLENRLSDFRAYRPKICLTGYPKYDNLDEYRLNDSDVWNYLKWEGHFRLLWTPRWTTNENSCNFFEYKDKLLEYCSKHKNIDFIFRPHPQSWIEWENTGELKKKAADEYKNRYEQHVNTSIDTSSDYLNTFYHSDCLITDTSSIVPEYFLTGKPIIYCFRENSRFIFDRHETYGEGMYWVKTWEELKKTLSMLENGEDPIKEKRQKLIEKYFEKNGTAGKKIVDEIVKDAFGRNFL